MADHARAADRRPQTSQARSIGASASETGNPSASQHIVARLRGGPDGKAHQPTRGPKALRHRRDGDLSHLGNRPLSRKSAPLGQPRAANPPTQSKASPSPVQSPPIAIHLPRGGEAALRLLAISALLAGLRDPATAAVPATMLALFARVEDRSSGQEHLPSRHLCRTMHRKPGAVPAANRAEQDRGRALARQR